jgi:hypothetical protein
MYFCTCGSLSPQKSLGRQIEIIRKSQKKSGQQIANTNCRICGRSANLRNYLKVLSYDTGGGV